MSFTNRSLNATLSSKRFHLSQKLVRSVRTTWRVISTPFPSLFLSSPSPLPSPLLICFLSLGLGSDICHFLEYISNLEQAGFKCGVSLLLLDTREVNCYCSSHFPRKTKPRAAKSPAQSSQPSPHLLTSDSERTHTSLDKVNHLNSVCFVNLAKFSFPK